MPVAADVTLPGGQQLRLQVNFCKNPRCANYGVAPTLRKRAHRTKGAPGEDYTLSGSRSGRVLACLLCGEFPPVKSNLGVGEELLRLAAYTEPPTPGGCPVKACSNAGRPLTAAHFIGYGKTAQGSPRYKCRACGKVFSVAVRSTLRQRLPHKNLEVYRLLVNKSPISRICEVADIQPKTFYDKLEFIHQQSLRFAGRMERSLPTMSLGNLDIAVDRQDYILNWSGRKDRRNVALRAVGSADLSSGFVFGMHLNFDAALDPVAVQASAVAAGDPEADPAFRQHARLWLESDYTNAAMEAARREAVRRPGSTLADDIASRYAESAIRADVEASGLPAASQRLPARGMQVRNEYTLYAHFYWLRTLLAGADRVRFYMDQESGIRAACLAAFKERVRQETCHAFYLRLGKERTVDEKRRLVAAARERFHAFALAHPGVEPRLIHRAMMKAEMRRAAAIGKWSDRWVAHPWPSVAEPEKALCHLSDLGRLGEDELAEHLLAGSLHAIDRFFMLLRRRVSILERSIVTASTARRTWHGYSAYNPANVQKVLDAFRVFYNYCLVGKDKRTPAMRLGLATRAYSQSEVLALPPGT